MRASLKVVLLAGLSLALPPAARAANPPLPNPILFVTQVPVPADFVTIGSVFGNQRPDVQSAARGGDLYILYPGGKLRNLTREAGLGDGFQGGFQGAKAIAVRDPSVHWSGTRALFSMVTGAPAQQYVDVETFWQIYEVTGLGENETVSITRVPNQPVRFNNVSPLYGTDGRILFTSDRPRGGELHLYPQLDEYEEAPTTTGLWSLDPVTGDLRLLDHAPSGAFTPILDRYGRVVYTRWDHLQRDQQADTDALDGDTYGTFDYADETAGAARLASRVEVFPEPRAARPDLLAGTPFEGHSFNQFFPWQINEDGTELETVNHIGRHELHRYFNRSRHDDGELVEFIGNDTGRFNQSSIENFLQIKEDPAVPGRYVGIDAPEFSTHAAGGIVAMTAPPDLPADQIAVAYVTDPVTRQVTDEGASPAPGSTGHYRDPLPLSNGMLLAAHAAETRADADTGSREHPGSRYAFRLKLLTPQNGYLAAGAPLTAGISKTVSSWDPDVKVQFSGELWELQPVEVRARPKPPARIAALDTPERRIFQEEGVDPEAFRSWLRARDLGVIVSRDVTTRDSADRQQPFNLQVAHGGARTTGSAGPLYQVSHLQIYQADQIRGLGGVAAPRSGRRVLARALHDPTVRNPASGGPPGSVRLAADGSMAAFVPAHRALTWHLVGETGESVVKERYWLTVQPGEIRTCTSCHGLNHQDQAGKPAPTNAPEALRSLLRFWKTDLGGAGSCQAGPTAHCLSDGRFRVAVTWKDFQGHTGEGRTIPLTGDTGAFWFFDTVNIELVVKVLDARGINGRFWVFYGALSNVEYRLTVTDTLTGMVKTYDNPSGRQASVGDTQGFPGTAGASAPAVAPSRSSSIAAAGTCADGPAALCLNGNRFRVEIAWKNFQGHTGAGKAVPLTGDTGAFWFFDDANLEVVVKVLDGRASNGKWWVFFGALSNVEYTVTVTDTTTNTRKVYRNPRDRFASVGDTAAF